MTNKKYFNAALIFCMGFLVPGLFLFLFVSGHDFLGLTLIGISGVIFCYGLIFLHRKKRPAAAKKILIAFSLFLSVFLLLCCVTLGFIISDSFGDDVQTLPYLVILGAGVNGTEPSLSLRYRLDAAIVYLNDHPETICIVSGGKGSFEDISEAACMHRYLTARGIPEERIWMEDRAENTRDNLRFSLAVIEEKTGTTPSCIGILSSEYHLFRAKHFARELGITPVGVPAKTGWITLRCNYFLREIPAVWYYCVLGG